MSNYIALWTDRINKAPAVSQPGFRNRPQMIQSAREHYCSLTLSRPFGMSGEQFDKENLDIAEFGKWVAKL